MKNIVIFSSFTPNKKICARMQKKLPNDAKIGYIPAGIHDKFSALHAGYELWWAGKMGFKDAVYFPIGTYYNEKGLAELLSCDAIAISGGNTFELLLMLQIRGLIPILRKYCEDGGILMGASAGGIVMCPKIRIAGFADPNYFGLKDLNSLGLVDFEVKPHWQTWAAYKGMFLNYKKQYGVNRLYGLSDGQAIWVTDNGVRFYGGMPDVM